MTFAGIYAGMIVEYRYIYDPQLQIRLVESLPSCRSLLERDSRKSDASGRNMELQVMITGIMIR